MGHGGSGGCHQGGGRRCHRIRPCGGVWATGQDLLELLGHGCQCDRLSFSDAAEVASRREDQLVVVS